MTILQTAKELLKKGIALNDQELIAMANQLIESNTEESVKIIKKRTKGVERKADGGDISETDTIPAILTPGEFVVTKEVAQTESSKNSIKQTSIPRQNVVDQFRLAEKQQEGSKRTPVTSRNRFNAWSDDGVESKEIVTPEVAITKRTREPIKKVEQKCQLCQSVETVNPVHVRDFYICDECLLNKKKGR